MPGFSKCGIYRIEIVDTQTDTVVATAAVDTDEEAKFIRNQVAKEDRVPREQYAIRRTELH